MFAVIQYPESTPGHGGFVAAVSQAELKATADSALTLALAYSVRVQMSFAHIQWISIILCKLCEFIYNSPPEHCLRRSWKCNFILVSAIVNHSLRQ